MRLIPSAAFIALVFISLTVASPAGAKGKQPKRITISVTEDGFVPRRIEVTKNAPVTLVFTRKTDKTCATKVVVHLSDEHKIERDLPLNKAVTVDVRFATSGELGFACGMGHVGGVIRVQ